MIAFLKGEFAVKNPNQVVVDVNGVGYELQISLQTYQAISNEANGKLFTYLHITENAQTLYGFHQQAEKDMFLHLISVSGVGAATARVMLSGMKPDEMIRCIIHGSAKQLESIKGIGKKTAERIIVELRDKLGKQAIESVGFGVSSGAGAINTFTSIQMDAATALASLGIPKMAADAAVAKALEQSPDASLEDIIKNALKNL